MTRRTCSASTERCATTFAELPRGTLHVPLPRARVERGQLRAPRPYGRAHVPRRDPRARRRPAHRGDRHPPAVTMWLPRHRVGPPRRDLERRDLVHSARERFAPVHRERFAPVHRERFAPVHRERFAPVHRERFAPVHRERFAPVHCERFAPVHCERFAPVHHERFAPRSSRAKSRDAPRRACSETAMHFANATRAFRVKPRSQLIAPAGCDCVDANRTDLRSWNQIAAATP
jgi:hypothetical protein